MRPGHPVDSHPAATQQCAMPEASIVLRDSTDADIPAIARIYGHWVRHGLASFELEPPDAAEMAGRRAAVLAGGYP